MAFGIDDLLIYAAISIGGSLLSRALTKPRRPRPAAFDGPTAQQGRSIPLAFGKFAIAPNVVWYGDYAPDTDDDNPDYNANMILTVCHGPLTSIEDIQFGGKSLRLAPPHEDDNLDSPIGTAQAVPHLPIVVTNVNLPSTISIQGRRWMAPSAGGPEGLVRVYHGGLAQPVDSITTHSWEKIPGLEGLGLGTARPGIVYLVFTRDTDPFRFTQNVPQPPDIVFVGTIIPRALFDLDLDDDPEPTSRYGSSNPFGSPSINGEANWAEVAYALITDVEKGLGLDDDLIDLDSLVASAKTIAGEGRGGSPVWEDGTPVEDMLDECMRHCNGALFVSPTTGKLTMALARGDYDPDDLDTVTVSTASDLQVTRPNWGGVVNSVTIKYREFFFGVPGPVDEVFGPVRFPKNGLVRYQSGGRNITDVSVHNETTAADLTEGVDYLIADADAGLFTLIRGTTLRDRDTITITYTGTQGTFGFRDAVAKDQDLGSIQIDGLREQQEDYSFLTSPVSANGKASERLNQLSKPLAQATWTEDRHGYAVKPFDVRKVTWAPFGMSEVPFRILEVDYGTLEDGRVRISAVEDVFATEVLPSGTGSGIGTPSSQAPAMAISCGDGGDVVRIELFAGDTSYSIELWQADDEDGTNAALVDTYVGTTTFVDDPPGTSHRARLVSPATLPGPYTPWITCDPSGTNPTPPTCILPTWVDLVTQGDPEGTLETVITDPQHRVLQVIFIAQVPGDTELDGEVFVEPPYNAAVEVFAGQTSHIIRRIVYVTCDGTQTTNSQTFDFTIPDDTPGTPTLTSAPYPILTHAAGSAMLGRTDVGAAWTELGWQVERKRVTLLPGTIRGHASVYLTSCPVGTYLAWRYSKDDGATFLPIDGVDGPKIAVDSTNIPTTPFTLVGVAVPIAEDAQGEVLVAAGTVGGTGTGDIILDQIEAQAEFEGVVAEPDPPDSDPQPPPENPACEVIAFDLSGYTDIAEMEGTGLWIFDDNTDEVGGTVTWTLDATHTTTSSKAIHAAFSDLPDGNYTLVFGFAAHATGLTPGKVYQPVNDVYRSSVSGYTWVDGDGNPTADEFITNVADPFTVDENGEVTFLIVFNIDIVSVPGALDDSAPFWIDGIRLVTPACITDDPDDIPNDGDPTVGDLYFVEPFDE